MFFPTVENNAKALSHNQEAADPAEKENDNIPSMESSNAGQKVKDKDSLSPGSKIARRVRSVALRS